MATVEKAQVPQGSKIADRLAGAYFADAWAVPSARPELSALGQFLLLAKSTPQWVEACMRLRNRVAGWVGLKNLGGLSAVVTDKPESAFRPGDRVGIFTLRENSFDEVLLVDRDRHLDVVLSLHRTPMPDGQLRITITTVVHVHNWLGRLYMLPVKPMHRLIAPATLRALARAT